MLILDKKSEDNTIAKFPSMRKSLGTEISFLSQKLCSENEDYFSCCFMPAFNFFFGHNFEGKNEKNQQTTKSMLNYQTCKKYHLAS